MKICSKKNWVQLYPALDCLFHTCLCIWYCSVAIIQIITIKIMVQQMLNASPFAARVKCLCVRGLLTDSMRILRIIRCEIHCHQYFIAC
jgi:hypothetical protein